MNSNSREYRERLIDEVKRFPVLYDTRHEHHRDVDVRDRCWTQIAERLGGANSEVLKREWKILRDSFRQALKKSRGGATTKAGQPCKKWRFQARMAFVLPYMTKRTQRKSLRDDVKMDISSLETDGGEEDEWGCGGVERGEDDGGGEVGGGGVEAGGGGAEALELFFASVCASARRLPAHEQRTLKRDVLHALLSAEQRADGGGGSHHLADTKPKIYDSF